MTQARTLPKHVDVAIVGAGVMGASVAFQLSRLSDRSVAVFDQIGPLGGMSGRTFGQVRLHYSNALTLQMAKAGIDHFANWEAEVGVGSSGYVPMGYLLTVKAAQFEAAQRNVALAQSLGIDSRFIGPEEIGAIEPAISIDGLEGAAWDPAGGYVDITRVTLGWLTAALGSGRVSVFGNARVDGLRVSGNRVSGVQIGAQVVSADHVVVATGPWAAELLGPLGFDVPIEPRRIDTMYMQLPKAARQLRTCVTDGTANIVIRPDMGATILAAAYPPEMALVRDPIVVPTEQSAAEHLARIEAAIATRFPGCSGAVPIRSVSGSYDITPDWHPVLGPLDSVRGLQVAVGFSGHGLKLSPAVGRVLAQGVLGIAPDFDIHALRAGRFSDNEPMYLAYGPGGRA